MAALNNHFEPTTNFVFERHVFRQAIQGMNDSSINFVKRLHKLASTCEFVDQNTEIREQFIDNCSCNLLRCRLLQEPNLTLEKTVEKAQAMELAKKQPIIMQPEEIEAAMAWLKLAQDKYDFISNK